MTIRCANCRQVYLPRPIVDLTGNVLIWGGLGCVLGPRQAEIMHVLLEAPNGGFVSKKEIAERVFGIIGVADEYKQIDQHIHCLRPKLARLNIVVEIRWGDAIAVHYTTPPPPLMPKLMENEDEKGAGTTKPVVQRNHRRIRQRKATGEAERRVG